MLGSFSNTVAGLRPATLLKKKLQRRFLLVNNFKINKSQYIALIVVSGSIKKLFSIDRVNIYFSRSMVNYFFSIDLNVWG